MLNNTKAYLEECLRQFNNQDETHHRFHVRTLGILTFAVTIFSLAIRWMQEPLSMAEQNAIFLMAITLSLAIFLGVSILMPSTWSRPIKLNRLREYLPESEESLTLKMADIYKKSVNHNWEIVDRMGSQMLFLTIFVSFELVVFICLHVHPFLG